MCESTWKRGQKRDYTDRPLTAEEKVFAEDYHHAIYYFMKDYHLDPGEWYDILIIPYLQAVKKYHCNLEAQQFSFFTVCNGVLWTAMKNHKRAERIQCRKPEGGIISLDYTVQGDNPFAEHKLDCYWIDTKQRVEEQILDKETLTLIINSLNEVQQRIFTMLLEGYQKYLIKEALCISQTILARQIERIREVTYTVLYRD